jgi:CHAT domain-containing protein
MATIPVGRPDSPRAIPVTISPGELLDKIAILEIKSERVRDEAKLRNVRAELAALAAARDQAITPSDELAALTAELKAVNEAIWDAEDALRAREMEKKFGQQFIDYARSVYFNNDRRSAIKRAINDKLAAEFVEEKEHPRYQ